MTPTRSRPLTIVADDLTGACDAGALFAGRAQSVDQRFLLSDANTPAVIETCRALDRGSSECLGERATKGERPLVALKLQRDR